MEDSTSVRLMKQLQFIAEIDKVKQIIRQTLLLDKSRQENDAEHSWHMAMAVFILHEHANETDIDLVKSVKMALIHDIVEIDAGDVFAYDTAGHHNKFENELKASERIFGLLPDDQAAEYKQLWLEFEKGETNEAKFVGAIDKFMPIYHNYLTEGQQWHKHGVTSEMVLKRNQPLQQGSDILWARVNEFIEECKEKGILE
ncbi:HD domain-containing protein [Saccharicrinis aurantiacus]|uniref:HD domain-containing protein n=1 Tax=Saccharicrinis aurantiacus TaxID=1849719 RepID=UPI00094FB671|nr:HD domain-containing protein [Saccharicrinis aurantiacus]